MANGERMFLLLFAVVILEDWISDFSWLGLGLWMYVAGCQFGNEREGRFSFLSRPGIMFFVFINLCAF